MTRFVAGATDRQLDAIADLGRLSERQLLERLVRSSEGWDKPQLIRIVVGSPHERTTHTPAEGRHKKRTTRKQREAWAATLREVEAPVSVQLQDNQEVDLSADVRDAAGNPAQAAALSWSSDNESVLTVVTGDDPTKVTVQATGTLGVATVIVSDDEDGDPSTAEYIGSLSFEVVSGPVASISVNAGEARSKS